MLRKVATHGRATTPQGKAEAAAPLCAHLLPTPNALRSSTIGVALTKLLHADTASCSAAPGAHPTCTGAGEAAGPGKLQHEAGQGPKTLNRAHS